MNFLQAFAPHASLHQHMFFWVLSLLLSETLKNQFVSASLRTSFSIWHLFQYNQQKLLYSPTNLKKKQWAGSGTGLSIHLSNQLHIWHTFHHTKPPLATDVLSFPQGFYSALSEVPVSKWPQAVYHTSMDETYLRPASPGNQEMSTLCVNLEYLQTPSTLLAGQLVMTARSPPFCNGCSWAGFNQYKKLSKLESTMKCCPLQPCPEQARGISMGQQHAGLFLAHVGRAYELKGLGRDHLWNTLIASALQRQAGHSSALRVLYHEKYLSGNWDKEPWP